MSPMMGIHQKQGELWAKAVDLGRRIPADHLLRRLDKVLQLDFVRQEVAGLYGRRGNVSVDPVVLMRMMLLLFLDDVRSERELMRLLPLRIDYLWFLGYGLDDEVPDHSVLSKARRRWGAAVFERLFARVIEQCLAAGLVGAGKVHVDASLVRANASRNSVVRDLVAQQMDKLQGDDPTPEDASEPPEQAPPPPKHKPANTTCRSKTDPDSRVVRHDGGKPSPCYKNHRVVDDKAGVVTALKTTHGTANEGNELMGMLEQHHQRTGQRPCTAVADSCYGDIANMVALAQAGITAHVADLGSRMVNARSLGIYPADAFAYDKPTDTFVCPAGQRLHRHHFHQRRGHWEYRTKRGVCAGCPLRSQCTRDKSGRTLKRHEHQELLDHARRQSHSEAAREDRRRRQWFQERNFAEAAVLHGFKRARWRGLWRQSIQDLLIATLQNLKILIRRQFWRLVWTLRSLLHALQTLHRAEQRIIAFYVPSTCRS